MAAFALPGLEELLSGCIRRDSSIGGTATHKALLAFSQKPTKIVVKQVHRHYSAKDTELVRFEKKGRVSSDRCRHLSSPPNRENHVGKVFISVDEEDKKVFVLYATETGGRTKAATRSFTMDVFTEMLPKQKVTTFTDVSAAEVQSQLASCMITRIAINPTSGKLVVLFHNCRNEHAPMHLWSGANRTLVTRVDFNNDANTFSFQILANFCTPLFSAAGVSFVGKGDGICFGIDTTSEDHKPVCVCVFVSMRAEEEQPQYQMMEYSTAVMNHLGAVVNGFMNLHGGPPMESVGVLRDFVIVRKSASQPSDVAKGDIGNLAAYSFKTGFTHDLTGWLQQQVIKLKAAVENETTSVVRVGLYDEDDCWVYDEMIGFNYETLSLGQHTLWTTYMDVREVLLEMNKQVGYKCPSCNCVQSTKPKICQTCRKIGAEKVMRGRLDLLLKGFTTRFCRQLCLETCWERHLMLHEIVRNNTSAQ